MFKQAFFFVSLVILEAAFSLPVEEKLEPVELYYRCIEPEKDENEPDKSPVIMLHGLLSTYRSYLDLDEVIAKRTKRKACAVDLRNHGDSPWNNRTDIAAMAADIGHFLDKHNIKRANLIGESLGGKIAIHYALTNPDRVDSLVVEDMTVNTIRNVALMTITFFLKVLKGFLYSQPKGLTQSEAMDWVEQYIQNIMHQIGVENAPEDFKKYIDFALVDGIWQPKHNMELLYTVGSNFHKIWTESKGVYTGPALFFYGTESLFRVEDYADNIHKHFPNAKLMPVEGAGHLIHEVYPEFDDIVVNFLNEIN